MRGARVSSIDRGSVTGPFQIALFSALFAIGVAVAAVGHARTFDRSAIVRASGTGRLVAQKTSFAVQPSLGRVVMRSIDGKIDLPPDLALVVDGAARPISLNHLRPGSKKELTADLPIDVDGASLPSTLSFRLDGDA